MRAWIWLALGAGTEIGWIAGLKLAASPWAWLATAACAVASVALALGATRDLPATTVYVLFIGLGSVGTVILEATVLGTALHPATYGFLTLLLVCIIGLKRTSAQPGAS
ncbi:DMT family transporter [Salinisphaera hydrothermalis]|uniref:Small multidrug resistance protein n=1 Tax=Salinisphaera hydrothermalis (strain C41B8) TaxID=1304275 RepID=A0A084IHT5_SALHC|nr:SMR family transporter [Salinisphaera hydrothermalis]KEZ76269.1 small multidrug resistance protein [Salinisphaera hydrothermalis C41B8]